MDPPLVSLQIAVIAIGAEFAWLTLVGNYRLLQRWRTRVRVVGLRDGKSAADTLPRRAPAFLAVFDGYGASNCLRFSGGSV
jgi:hypothetical protein